MVARAAQSTLVYQSRLLTHTAGLYNWRMRDLSSACGEVLARVGVNLPRDAGLLLVGHGSREAAGVEEFLATARLVAAAAGDVPAEACFLEFARPTIAEGFRRLVARGAKQVVVVPVLLFSAGHAKRDIPEAACRVAREFSGIAVWQAQHLGCQSDLVALSQQRYEEAIVGQPSDLTPADNWLVLVGRGSWDAGATAEMHAFAALRKRSLRRSS